MWVWCTRVCVCRKINRRTDRQTDIHIKRLTDMQADRVGRGRRMRGWSMHGQARTRMEHAREGARADEASRGNHVFDTHEHIYMDRQTNRLDDVEYTMSRQCL